MKKKIAALFGFFVVALSVVLVFNTLRLTSIQIDAEPAFDIPMNEIAAAERLAGALRIATISHEDPADFDGEPFLQFHTYLEETFPNVHSTLTWETVNEYSLLYRWEGSDHSLAPIAVLAHMDVVPVEPGTEDKWTHEAYEGRIEDGYVWGRGALDMKNILVASLEAVEMLVEQGVQPRRTIYLAFGHDEEVGGQNGATAIAALLQSRGIQLDHVIDEGGAIADGLVPGIPGTVALIGIAEKGFMSIELLVEMDGGHSSMPPAQTAVGILSAGIQRLEEHQMPHAITGATEAMFDYIGPEMPFGKRIFIANRWLFGGLIKKMFASSAEGAAMLRTTTAPTIFQAGVKANVLPSTARAVVNHRILSGDSTAQVLEHVRRTVDDPRIQVQPVDGFVSEPSPVSDVNSESFAMLSRTIREVFPGTVVTPYLVVGGTDSRHYAGVANNVFRFGGTRIGPDDMGRVHGTDERIGVDAYADLVRFFIQYLNNTAL
jgi:carboxypeptidase PM20D1